MIGATSGVGLWSIGVPVALAPGVLAGLLTFVPYVGALVSAVPALLVALTHGVPQAVSVAVLYSAIHLPDGCILIPLVQTGTAHLPPALTLTAQALLWSVWGTVGLTMATPLAAAAMVITRMVYLEDELGEREHRNG